MKINLDPKMGYGIVAVVVVIAALLVFRGATADQKAPLPDASMFNGKGAKTPTPPK